MAAAEAYIEELLTQKQREPPRRPPTYIIKDIRLFLNSITRSMDVMRLAGVDAKLEKTESEETITLTIEIPKLPKKRAAG